MKVNERRSVVGGGLIGHSTGRQSLSTVGGTHVCPPQPWREIDAHGPRFATVAENAAAAFYWLTYPISIVLILDMSANTAQTP